MSDPYQDPPAGRRFPDPVPNNRSLWVWTVVTIVAVVLTALSVWTIIGDDRTAGNPPDTSTGQNER